MDINTTALSYQDTRKENALEHRYITVVLSEKALTDPFPFRCIGCGFVVFNTNNIPRAIFDVKLNVEDIYKSSDFRCKKCKITYRIT